MKLGKAIGTIGGLTMVSRVLGFVREMVMARVLGANMYADAFLVAFRLPNTFRRFFGEGAFSAGFVPLFSQRYHGKGGIDEARRFSEEVLAVFLPVLLIFTVIGQIAMPAMVWLLASGYAGDPEKFDLTVWLSRLTFPYLMLISLVSLYSGVLNSMHKFAAAAFAPALLNLAMLVALLLVRDGGAKSAQALAIAVVVGGIVQLALVLWSAHKAGVSLRVRRPRITPGVRQFFRVVIPATFAAGVYQVSILIDTQFVSYLAEGSMAHLNYADRLNQLPLGIIGTALGTAILPAISKYVDQGKADEAEKIQNQALELGMLLTLPAAIAFAAAGVPLVTALFRGGAFQPEDAIITGTTLGIIALGLPAYVLVKVFTPGFFAREDTKTPLRIAIWVLAANIALNFALVPFFGLYGLAAALALTAWLNCALLYLTLHKRGHLTIAPDVANRVARQLLCALAMGVTLYGVNLLMGPMFNGTTFERMVALSTLIGSGGVVYFGLGWMIGAVNREDVMILLRRRRPEEAASD
ncbi:MAG: murein biosynthesis integral membrane protein MurJ [Sphingomonadaceae bacterium]|jgi:putative peptidoglycan lipid II flippase|nr:murein biosynthesis integral membrane protein MurJ [Sphingomonadaceae bacterium]NBU78589.1 murein biosynthesis integral membrane protein MurJ [Sphingomonadaceae bacterium]